MGLIEDYIRANILAGEEGNFNDRFIAFLARSFIVDGSPEGVIAAPPGAAAWNIQGGSGTTLYVKESGTGNTGWVGYGAGGGGGGGFTQEQIEDFIGLMVSGNTETGITVVYDDAAGKFNFTTDVLQAEIDDVVTDLANHEGAADPHTAYLLESLIDAQGDLIVGTADNAAGRLAKGSRGQMLIAGAATLEYMHQALGSRFKSGHYYSAMFTTGNANLTMPQDRLHCIPFYVGKSQTFDRIAINVPTAVAATTIRLGIYSDSGEFYPGALVLDAGTVDSSTTGSKTITINQTLAPGWYWLGAVAQGGTPTVRSHTMVVPYVAESSDPNNSVGASYYETGVSGALPANFTATTNVSSGPRIHLRAA